MKDRGLYKRLIDAASSQEFHQLLSSEESRLESEE